MPKVQFVFALHNHQPVGNFEFVAEEAYHKSYLPLIQLLGKHPGIKVTLHYTGILFHFFEKRHPEFIDMLKELIAAGRAEILSGGFYEPVLAVLPDEDKVGQVQALSAYIRKRLGYRPGGMWLAERVWEPQLPKFIAAAGISHVVVDDFHFKMAGLRNDQLDGYYVTDDQGGLVRIFPGSELLRYLIPFHAPEETITHLSGFRSDERNRLVVMADDGEKFGVWPETYHSVYEEGWLERFFTLIEQNSDWLETTTFSEYLEKEQPLGTVYLPTASYREMGEWSLPTRAVGEYKEVLAKIKGGPDFELFRPFIKGGFWRNFLSKYPESNRMQKRMIMVSRKVHEALQLPGNGKGAERTQMVDHLYQSQCNDAYWHGVFGGLYLPHLRSAVYEHMLRAEFLADRARKAGTAKAVTRKSAGRNEKASWLAVETGDFDSDGSDEVMLNSGLINLFIDPAKGGRITEFDWKPRFFNLFNGLTRRREAYHDKILQLADRGASASGGAKTIHERFAVKEEGLHNLLVYDTYERSSLLDHFLGSGVDLEGFMKSAYHEAGDFLGAPYRMKPKKTAASASVLLERDGTVGGLGVRVRKEISLRSAGHEVKVRYAVTNQSSEELNSTFGPEFNFSLLAGNAHDRYYDIPGHVLDRRNLASTGETNDVNRASLVDEWLKLKVTLAFEQPVALWRAPIETVSQSEEGFERVYQSSMVMPLWRISLRPGSTWKTTIRISVE
jgi:4-alpha-glucanotransferase